MSLYVSLFRALCVIITAGSRKTIVYEHSIPLGGNLPAGPKIFASNHPSNVDPAYFYHLMDNPALMIMDWGMNVPLVGPLMRECGFISVGKDGHAAYSLALNALLSGRNVYICPEGKLSGPGTKPKTGAARLAIQTGYPIIPIGIRHQGRIYSIPIGNGRFVKYMPFGETHITFGEPMYARLAFGDTRRAHWMSERLMQIIKVLSE